VNATSTTRLRVETGGEGVAAHVGLHALGRFGDRLALGDLLSARIPIAGERLPLHDRGKVLVQAMLMMAGGGEACSDIEKLRAQPSLFGEVPSDSTLYRTFFQLDPKTVAGLWEAMAQARSVVWSRAAATTGKSPVILDIDSSLHEIHSENKEQTGPTYKGGFGFHPIYCFADATGETLAERLRPGNAGPATSASRWWRAPTSRSTLRSAGSSPTSRLGAPPFDRTATSGLARRWPRSPTWSTCRTGRQAPG